ncbi:MAG: prolipoprotein diacylglyceryl transferase family protein [Mariniblastus sp.]
MRQTLIFIPHFLFEGPLLIAWLIIGALVLAFLFKRHGNANETWSFLPVYGIIAIVLAFVVPHLEVDGINPDDPTGPYIKQGLAVRGYGLFLLLAITSGVSLVLSRCRQVNLTTDQILGLCFWMMVVGIFGARLFYVLQKRDEFFNEGLSFTELVIAMADMTKGGLVVYGSLIGGVIAAFVYLKINRLPFGRTADLLAPGMVLGLAIGRIGCLMNGCCFGGVCDAPLPSVTFPAGSAPYMRQLTEGDLLGIKARKLDDKKAAFPLLVESVEQGSKADELGIKVGDKIAIQTPGDQYIRFRKQTPDYVPRNGNEFVSYIESDRQARMMLPIDELPDRSLSTYPTQIYSAINAGLLCLVLWFYWTVRKTDGEVFALMLIFYSIGRFLMELIRQDEFGQFGTTLTISQWVSILTIAAGLAFFFYTRAYGSKATPPSLA